MPRPAPLVFADLLAVPAVDAPAFTRGVLVRSSSTGQDGMLAVDGDINTGWSSLPGLPLPQWMMADLPQEVEINQVTLRTGQAASGFVETYDGKARRWIRQGRFQLTDGQDVATITFAPTRTRRIRVTVESAAAGKLATVYELTWSLVPVTTQTQPF